MEQTTIQDIVEEIYLESQVSEDSVFRNKPRHLMYTHAKKGLDKLNLSFANNLKGMNINIPMSCKVFKPEDYYQFVRAYLINCDGKTIEIKRNQNIPEKIFHYLVNCDGSLLEKCEGEYMKDECLVCNPSKGNKSDNSCNTCHGSGYYIPGEMQQLLDDLNRYKDSWIKVNDDFFEFSSDLEEMAVIIEYIGNQAGGVEECKIVIDGEMEEALDYYIRWKLLEHGQETKAFAEEYRRKYKNAKTIASSKKNALNVSDIYSIMLKR